LALLLILSLLKSLILSVPEVRHTPLIWFPDHLSTRLLVISFNLSTFFVFTTIINFPLNISIAIFWLWTCDLSWVNFTFILVGVCKNQTLVSTLFTFCPPFPPEVIVVITKSLRISFSLISWIPRTFNSSSFKTGKHQHCKYSNPLIIRIEWTRTSLWTPLWPTTLIKKVFPLREYSNIYHIQLLYYNVSYPIKSSSDGTIWNPARLAWYCWYQQS